MRKVLLQISNVEFFLGYMVYTLIDLDSWSIIAFAPMQMFLGLFNRCPVSSMG